MTNSLLGKSKQLNKNKQTFKVFQSFLCRSYRRRERRGVGLLLISDNGAATPAPDLDLVLERLGTLPCTGDSLLSVPVLCRRSSSLSSE